MALITSFAILFINLKYKDNGYSIYNLSTDKHRYRDIVLHCDNIMRRYNTIYLLTNIGIETLYFSVILS